MTRHRSDPPEDAGRPVYESEAFTPDPDARRRDARRRRRRFYGGVLSGALAGLLVFSAVGVTLLTLFRDSIPSQWDPSAPLDLGAPATFVQDWKIARARDDLPACQAALDRVGAAYREEESRRFQPPCAKVNIVLASRFHRAELEPLETRCAVAMAMHRWERDVVQPAAQKHFGEGVAKLLHFGSYGCRKIAGTSFWSEHATANAIDIAGFQTESGKRVSVLFHWPEADTDRGRFLREVGRGACEHFHTVLGPDFNAAHADHFHFDLGFWRACE